MSIDGVVVGTIDRGLMILVGVTHTDTEVDVEAIASKLLGLRLFRDPNGKMNLDIREVGGAVLVVSQFTLYGDARRGRRPSFSEAAAPEVAEPLLELLVSRLAGAGVRTASGRFGAMMDVEIHNDGPVTIVVETEHGRFV